MSALETPPTPFDTHDLLGSFLSDKRILSFGDTLVLFRDTEEFTRRLHLAARTAGHRLDPESRPVEYVPQSHCGDTGPFTKIGDYAYQREWRFITEEPIPGDSITLTLGSLMDLGPLRLDLADHFQTTAT
jgi:hypothetical protein